MYLEKSLKDEISNMFCELLNNLDDDKKITKTDAEMLIDAIDTEKLLAYLDICKDQTIINLGYSLGNKDYPKQVDEHFDFLILKVMEQANKNRKSGTYSGAEVISSRTPPNIDIVLSNTPVGTGLKINEQDNNSIVSPRAFE